MTEDAKERRRARDREKARKRRLRKAEERRAAKTAAPTISKTSPYHRSQLPRAPEMTRAELRAMLTEAVRNTGAHR